MCRLSHNPPSTFCPSQHGTTATFCTPWRKFPSSTCPSSTLPSLVTMARRLPFCPDMENGVLYSMYCLCPGTLKFTVVVLSSDNERLERRLRATSRGVCLVGGEPLDVPRPKRGRSAARPGRVERGGHDVGHLFWPGTRAVPVRRGLALADERARPPEHPVVPAGA